MYKSSVNIALCGFYGKNNFGDDLLARCLINHLSFNNNYVTLYSDFEDGHIVNGLKNIDRVINNNDVIIIGGGGLVAPNFWMLKEPVIKALKAHNKLVIFLNVNLASKYEGESLFWESLSGLSSYWFVRDKYSVNFLSSLNFNVNYLPDISFSSGVVNEHKNHNTKNMSVFLNDYVFHDIFYSDSIDNYVKAQYNIRIIAKFLDWMSHFGWKIEFVPSHVTRGVNDMLPSMAVLSIMKKKQAVKWPIDVLNESQIIDKITTSDLILSMRYHSTAVAMASTVPCLDVTHHDKNRNLLFDADLQQASAEYHNLTHDNLVKACNFAESDSYKIKVIKYNKEANNLWDNFAPIYNNIVQAHYDI